VDNSLVKVQTAMVARLPPPMQMLANQQQGSSQQRVVHRVTAGMFFLMMVGVSITSGITMVGDQIQAWTATFAAVFDAMALGHTYWLLALLLFTPTNNQQECLTPSKRKFGFQLSTQQTA
jgi:hypothetical protein